MLLYIGVFVLLILIAMSQAAFSLLTAGIKFKGIKETEKDIFKKGSSILVIQSEV